MFYMYVTILQMNAAGKMEECARTKKTNTRRPHGDGEYDGTARRVKSNGWRARLASTANMSCEARNERVQARCRGRARANNSSRRVQPGKKATRAGEERTRMRPERTRLGGTGEARSTMQARPGRGTDRGDKSSQSWCSLRNRLGES